MSDHVYEKLNLYQEPFYLYWRYLFVRCPLEPYYFQLNLNLLYQYYDNLSCSVLVGFSFWMYSNFVKNFPLRWSGRSRRVNISRDLFVYLTHLEKNWEWQQMPSSQWPDILAKYPPPLTYLLDLCTNSFCTNRSHLVTKSSRSLSMPPNRALHHITTSYNTYHPVHTDRSYFNVSFLTCPHPHPSSLQITRASSHVFWLGFVLDLLVLARFCSGFLFFWLSFLLAGSLGNTCFGHFVFVCCSFCEFLDFLHFREILVLVGLCSVLPARARRRHLQLARGSVYSGWFRSHRWLLYVQSRPSTYPSTRTTPLHTTTLHHTLTHSTRHVSILDKLFRNIPLRVVIS